MQRRIEEARQRLRQAIPPPEDEEHAGTAFPQDPKDPQT
jgi:hypothetical protein